MATEPMTAAEYRAKADEKWVRSVSDYRDAEEPRILAALEEREALLGERDRLGGEAENFRELARIRLKRVEQLDADVAQLKVEVADWKELHGQAASRAEFQKSDAAVGALVRRIREHRPEVYFSWNPHPMNYNLDESGLSAALDSLLPKEPEVVTGPSGWTYEKTSEFVRQNDHTNGSIAIRHADHENVPPCDRELVTKMLGGFRV